MLLAQAYYQNKKYDQALYNVEKAMALAKELTNHSLPEIGDAFGGRDHTTIMYGCEKVADLMERDDRLRRQVYQIREKLYGSTIAV